MDKKEAVKFLDTHCPGWADAPIPLHYVKAQASPRVRGVAVKAVAIASVSKKPKATTKATTTTKTKEG